MENYDLPRQATTANSGLDSATKGSRETQTPPKNDKIWPLENEDAEKKRNKKIAKEFNGRRGFNGQWFRRPQKQPDSAASSASFDQAPALECDEKGRIIYRNQLGQTYHKYDDVATYLSPTNYVPKRLIVQSTKYVRNNQLDTGDWRRTKMEGNVPLVLKMSEWALSPAHRHEGGFSSVLGRIDSTIRTLIVGLPLQILLSFPSTASWDNANISETYTDWPGYHWRWPKHAINPLDMRPSSTASSALSKKKPSSRKRLLRPRQLIVLQGDQWVLDPKPDKSISYLFISYANMHFDTNNSEPGRRMISAMAAFATLKAGKQAYWLDYRCRAPEPGPELDADVYRMCDVIRGADRVVVMLKGDAPQLKQDWGSRMWTLPEALLAPGDNLYFCTPEEDTFKIISMNKVELSGSVWEDESTDEEDSPTRLLAEHFTGLLTLSRLEILSNAIAALASRFGKNYTANAQADIAYALMGLLHYRIEKDPDDTVFQAIARLSLANDSDNLIERMVCLFPDPRLAGPAFMKLAPPDMFLTHLWDIEPLCQVVGVGDEDNTVLLDNCRAMHIRWKNFPRMEVTRHQGFKKMIAEMFVVSGAWWFLFGINLTITYAPFLTYADELPAHTLLLALKLLVGAFFTVGLLLSFLGPYSVRRLYGGQVLQSSPKLVGFEGVMPLDKLEKMVFGNNNGRLSYEPSSTPFSYNYRDPKERVGLEPDWIKSGRAEDIMAVEKQLPPGHHLFTLVDAGTLSVSIFSAERPPTVALLCGREGGMLRAVLCSWRFGNDCLYKETVVRMPSDVYEAATTKGWLKLSLGGNVDS